MSRITFRTALITGASAGLGAEFARRLAGAGNTLAPGALATSEGIESVERRIAEDATLDLLINNAGFSGGRSFVERDAAVHMDMIQVHVAATVRVRRAAPPGVCSRGR